MLGADVGARAPRQEEIMTRQVTCECGYIAQADNDDAVLAQIRDHLRTDHPQLNEAVTDDDIRGWIEIIA